jgi:Na+ dependent nucleoside transporter C-terminus
VLDAAAQGAANAVMLVLNIVANLIAFLAFVAFLDAVVSWAAGLVGAPYITFQVRCLQSVPKPHDLLSLWGCTSAGSSPIRSGMTLFVLHGPVYPTR